MFGGDPAGARLHWQFPRMSNIAEAFAYARQAHQAGRVKEAEELYRRILDADPSFLDAWYLRGVACHALGRGDDAIHSFERALAIQPGHVFALNHLGIVLAQVRRWGEAVSCFQRALDLRPDFAEAWRNQGLVLSALGKPDEAIAAFRAAAKAQPDFFDAHLRLGQTLSAQSRSDEAIGSLQNALRLKPDSAEAHFQLGLVYAKSGRLDEAESRFREAIRRSPTEAQYHNNLGIALGFLEQTEESILRFHEALRLQPDLAEAHNNLALALAKRGALDEAVRSFREALRLKPDYADAHNNLGITLKDLRRFEEAIAHFHTALRLKPELAEAHCNLGLTLERMGRVDEAIQSYQDAILKRFAYPEVHSNLGLAYLKLGKNAEAVSCFEQALKLRPHFSEAHSNLLLCLNYDPTRPAAELYDRHCEWAERHAQAAPFVPFPSRDHRQDRPLRVGYVSGDFKRHPAACFLAPILEHHDPAHVSSVCYADVALPDDLTERLRTWAREWRSICGMSDIEVTELVRSDRIDILIDLSGHTAHHRLGVFARKPAPLQGTYIGYPNTTGLSTVDFRLTDAIADPPGEPLAYTEELVRLPRGFCCYRPPDHTPDVTPPPCTLGKPFTFGSMHNLAKLGTPVLDLWCDVLRAVPHARLLMFRDVLTGSRRDELRRFFTERGIADERLLLEYALPAQGGHFALYERIDVALDPFPWTGHTTACESLWMGVPIVTLSGNRHAGRMVASVLVHAGFSEWIATTREQYVAIAANLAADPASLAPIRQQMRARLLASTLCDGRAFTSDLEEVYRRLWTRACGGDSG
jgi:predicted O-linked N-acetylglucosamine transferase (SPINDLY family)